MNESSSFIAVEPSAFLAALKVYFEAFAERNRAHRAELLARCLTTDAEIWGPKRLFAGYSAISEKIAGFHNNWPDCRLVLASGINTFGNVARFAHSIVSPAGSVVASGQSVLELAPDGRIRRVIAFWEALPPIPAQWPEHLAIAPRHHTSQ